MKSKSKSCKAKIHQAHLQQNQAQESSQIYSAYEEQFKDIFISLPKVENTDEITFDQCYQIIQKMNLDIEMPRVKFNKFMKIVDFDQNHLINYQEFKRMLLIASEATNGFFDNLLLLFWAADASCDGQIQVNEFEEVLKRTRITGFELIDWKTEIGEGVDFQKFVAIFQKYSSSEQWTKILDNL